MYSIPSSPGRYILKIHFFIELGLKMIQFKIQFKTKSGIFIQKNIHSIESWIFNRIIHSKKLRKTIQNSKISPKYGFGALLGPLYRSGSPLIWNIGVFGFLSTWYQSPIILRGPMRFAIWGPPGAKFNDMSHFGPFLRVSIEGWPQFTRPPWKI